MLFAYSIIAVVLAVMVVRLVLPERERRKRQRNYGSVVNTSRRRSVQLFTKVK